MFVFLHWVQHVRRDPLRRPNLHARSGPEEDSSGHTHPQVARTHCRVCLARALPVAAVVHALFASMPAVAMCGRAVVLCGAGVLAWLQRAPTDSCVYCMHDGGNHEQHDKYNEGMTVGPYNPRPRVIDASLVAAARKGLTSPWADDGTVSFSTEHRDRYLGLIPDRIAASDKKPPDDARAASEHGPSANLAAEPVDAAQAQRPQPSSCDASAAATTSESPADPGGQATGRSGMTEDSLLLEAAGVAPSALALQGEEGEPPLWDAAAAGGSVTHAPRGTASAAHGGAARAIGRRKSLPHSPGTHTPPPGTGATPPHAATGASRDDAAERRPSPPPPRQRAAGAGAGAKLAGERQAAGSRPSARVRPSSTSASGRASPRDGALQANRCAAGDGKAGGAAGREGGALVAGAGPNSPAKGDGPLLLGDEGTWIPFYSNQWYGCAGVAGLP